MGDVFTRLAERVLNQRPTITPRVPGMFEHPEPPREASMEPEADMSRAVMAVGDQTPPGDGRGMKVQPPPPRAGDRRGAADTAPRVVARRADVPAAPRGAAAAVGGPEHRPDARVTRAEDSLRKSDPAAQTHRIVPVLSPPPPSRDSSVRAAHRGAAAEPDVHINIGRIEIRSAAPAPAAVAPPPVVRPHEGGDRPGGLSLSAYLRGDDGRPR